MGAEGVKFALGAAGRYGYVAGEAIEVEMERPCQIIK